MLVKDLREFIKDLKDNDYVTIIEEKEIQIFLRKLQMY